MGPGCAPGRAQKLDGAGGLQRVRDRPGRGVCVPEASVVFGWLGGLLGGGCGLCGFRFGSVQSSSIQNSRPVQFRSGCALCGAWPGRQRHWQWQFQPSKQVVAVRAVAQAVGSGYGRGEGQQLARWAGSGQLGGQWGRV